MKLDDIPQPESPVTLAALEVATAYCSPSLVNHSVRSYLWAAAYGLLHQVPFDVELLYVSALLHDLGLVSPFDSHALPFEEASGHVAWVFGAGAGWPSTRCERAAGIIVRHMRDDVDPTVDAEGHLLQIATGLDISGRGLEMWPAELRLEVLEQVPRLALGAEFLRCFEEQAHRKPDSSAAAAVRSGIADRIMTNPLDRAQNEPVPPVGRSKPERSGQTHSRPH
jgi:hypothetical protein